MMGNMTKGDMQGEVAGGLENGAAARMDKMDGEMKPKMCMKKMLCAKMCIAKKMGWVQKNGEDMELNEEEIQEQLNTANVGKKGCLKEVAAKCKACAKKMDQKAIEMITGSRMGRPDPMLLKKVKVLAGLGCVHEKFEEACMGKINMALKKMIKKHMEENGEDEEEEEEENEEANA